MRPFKKGIKSFNSGELGNPYPVNTEDHREFELGFNKAYFARLERQKDYERKINKKGPKGR